MPAGRPEPPRQNAPVADLMPVVYTELRRIAARYISRERPGQTLQATALVNEAFLRLAAERPRDFQNRTHFVAIAALSMRQVLVQRARARRAVKRGGAPARITLDDQVAVEGGSDRQAFGVARDVELLALDEALNRLSALDPELVRLVELRYFGGLTVEETAEALESSPATVKRQWAVARAWLKRALDATSEHDASRQTKQLLLEKRRGNLLSLAQSVTRRCRPRPRVDD